MKKQVMLWMPLLLLGGARLGIAQEVNLKKQEKQDILFMAEEEKLARDVYRAFLTQYDLPVFTNISRSEQWHMQMMTDLATTFGLEVPAPVVLDEEGIFANRDLQILYDRWTKEGKASLEAALKISALVEETDIRDLTVALGNTENEDIRSVYERLRNASGNHLRAFTGHLKARGIDYQPAVLDKAVFERILAEKTGPAGDPPCQNRPGCCKKAQ